MILGVLRQRVLVNWSSPWASNALSQQASDSYQSCALQGTMSDMIDSNPGTQRGDFQTGVIFPRWGTTAYSTKDRNWQVGLHEMQQQTATQRVGLPINLSQPSLISTQVQVNHSTPTTQT